MFEYAEFLSSDSSNNCGCSFVGVFLFQKNGRRISILSLARFPRRHLQLLNHCKISIILHKLFPCRFQSISAMSVRHSSKFICVRRVVSGQSRRPVCSFAKLSACSLGLNMSGTSSGNIVPALASAAPLGSRITAQTMCTVMPRPTLVSNELAQSNTFSDPSLESKFYNPLSLLRGTMKKLVENKEELIDATNESKVLLDNTRFLETKDRFVRVEIYSLKPVLE